MEARSTTLLVVADEQGNSHLLKESVEGGAETRDVRIVFVSGVDDADRELRDTHFDAIFLDLGSLDSYCLTLLERMRSVAGRVPIIVVVESATQDAVSDVLIRGAQDCLPRSVISPTVVWRSLRYAIERSRSEKERERLEEQLFRAERMESIGRLSGGVAHDFNNLLTIILGQCDLLKDADLRDAWEQNALEEIHNAARRGAALTNQLLAFSRQQVLHPQPVDLNEAVQEARKMLERLVGEDVELIEEIEPDLSTVMIDPTRLDQSIMNLVVNARDAMPGGGTVRLVTSTVSLAPDDTRRFPFEIEPGEYVRLSITDTGTGIDEDHLELVFEPFFTTKERGKGTGLGLATVYGIVKQSRGYVHVESTPGEGTSVHLFFPPADERARDAAERSGFADTGLESVGGPETILLVEDDGAVRATTRRVLEKLGYRVLSASGAEEALALLENQDDVHALITDVIMPGMGGEALAEEVGRIRPDTRILFMSGYTEDRVAREKLGREAAHFLDKPFTTEELARKVRGILDDSLTPSAG